MRMRAAEISARIDWRAVLANLGVPGAALRNRHGPCPACGGKDRFRFDNRHQRGDFFCNSCGPGDGFNLLMRVHGWDFRTACDEVLRAAGLGDSTSAAPTKAKTATTSVSTQEIAQPTARVRRLLAQTCAVADCDDAVEYLASRHLWPLPPDCKLRAHPSVEYFTDGNRIGRFPALIAAIKDIDGALVSLHATYLNAGKKLTDHEPRKIFSPLTGRVGCAVRLQDVAGDVLGVAEGIETALSAARLHGVPTWAAVNATLLAKFEPPANVRRLIVFADRDVAGLDAAARLMQNLQGRVVLEIRTPTAPAKDWADVLANA